jgi:hypothetical protein
MAITKQRTNNIDDFIKAAPDAKRKGVKKGKREQISLTIEPGLLDKIDEFAAQRGQSRAAMINLAIFEFLQKSGAV